MFKVLVGIGVIAIFLVILLHGISSAQTRIPTNVVVEGSEVYWDPVTQDIQGNVEVLEHYEVALTASGVQPDTSILKSLNVSSPTTKISAEMLCADQPIGSYDVWCRAVDLAQNKSAWAGPLEIYWDRVLPKSPVNLRITVNVNVTVTPP